MLSGSNAEGLNTVLRIRYSAPLGYSWLSQCPESGPFSCGPAFPCRLRSTEIVCLNPTESGAPTEPKGPAISPLISVGWPPCQAFNELRVLNGLCGPASGSRGQDSHQVVVVGVYECQARSTGLPGG